MPGGINDRNGTNAVGQQRRGTMPYYDNLESFGDTTAVITDLGQRFSYRQLADAADRLHGAVTETKRDIQEKSKELIHRNLVFCFCTNTVGALYGYLSCLRHGDVPLLLADGLDEDLCSSLIMTYRPQYLYLPERLAERYTTSISKKDEMPNAMTCVYQEQNYVLLKTQYEPELMYRELALLLTTSGSTGSPKLVRQSYRNIQSNAEAIVEYLQLNETERPITTLPMQYTYGLSIINSHLLVGATLLLTEAPILQREFWDFFVCQGATSFGGVPYTYEMLKRLKFFGRELPTLRTMTQAGGKLSPELHREFAEYAQKSGKRFVVMYGQTEATARMGWLPPERALEKYGSMGIAIPHGELWLKDVEGKKIKEPDIVGELVYEGENVTLGYAEQRVDLEKGDERFGVLETGDMAKQDEDGYFYIVGRKKRFLKLFGSRVNLDETERLVKELYPEVDCACAGRDDLLYIFVTIEQEEQKQEMLHTISHKLGFHPRALRIKSVEAIPKNEAGKTLYINLEQYYDDIIDR